MNLEDTEPTGQDGAGAGFFSFSVQLAEIATAISLLPNPQGSAEQNKNPAETTYRDAKTPEPATP